jgi:patatin-like phospholipase/acyl hydrolase
VCFSLLIEFRIMPGVEWQAAAAAAVGEHNNECLHRDCFHVKENGGGAAAAAMQQVWESGGGGGERGKVCILSIDGGGGMLRGIIPARVLAYLEELLKRKSGNSEARIADYFDVVAGTSVGGILATMLCACDANNRPLFTAEETWKLIAEKGRSVFFNQLLPTSRMWSRLRGLMRPRFSSKRLEALLKQYLIRDGRPLTLRDTMKPVLIPCYDLATAGPFLFSRADALENQTWNFNLWEVCRATTAVPSLFKPAYMTSVDGNTSCTAVDGGVVMHNPTAAAVTHVLHNKLEFPRVQGVNDLLVLSLGTGQMDQPYAYNTVRGWGTFQWVKPIANIVLDSISDMVDHTISMSFGDFRQQYLRIQVMMGCAFKMVFHIPCFFLSLQHCAVQAKSMHSRVLLVCFEIVECNNYMKLLMQRKILSLRVWKV